MTRWLPLLLLAALLAQVVPGSAAAIERRKDQYPTQGGYMVVPAPYAIPGIGAGIAFTVSGSN
ncbi:MAG: hypothetical protein V3S29_14590, partial [bacterium]